MPNFKFIVVGLFSALLIVTGVLVTPIWEYSPFACVALALAILYFSIDGRRRFQLSLGLSALSLVLSVLAMAMFGIAEDTTFNLASFDAQANGLEQLPFSHQWIEQMSPAKYWELLLNASIAVLIITATFCLLVPIR